MLRRCALVVIILGVLLTVGANVDSRIFPKKPVFKYEADTITIPSGDANEFTATIANVNGIIRQVTVNLNDNSNNVTSTIQIRNPDGAVLWTEAAVAENQIAVFQYNTRSSTDLPMAILCASETITIGVTPDGDPGASTLTATVKIWGI